MSDSSSIGHGRTCRPRGPRTPNVKIVGSKRGIIADVRGLLLAVVVTAASVSDSAIGRDLLDLAIRAHPTLAKTWVDAGFKTTLVVLS